MENFTLYLLTALCLMFVIEGLLYALFPDAMRRMMAYALTLPTDKFRTYGAGIALTGLSLLWVISRIG